MLDNLKGFHVETTNICTLKCPKCSRTDFIARFPSKWSNKQLDLDSFKQFLDIDLKQKMFILSGNYGDPIYYNNLFELLRWIKLHGANAFIYTNGSYKNKDWWTELGSILDFDDRIVFAIDGTPENFTKYRINADWKSIELGIKTVVNYTTTSWKFIPFQFNENNIDEAKKIADSLGVHSFYVDPSSRWDSLQDPLKPTVIHPLYEQKIVWKPKIDVTLDPKCKSNNVEHYISADGYYMPCCYIGDHRFYYSSEFYKNKEKYHISTTTISQVLESLTEYYSTLESSKFNYCTFSCPKI
jgi:MoaA/NifB/PqqE/SkfB family radical SAM enzyme